MGIFSKQKPKADEVVPETQLLEVINKFTGWLPKNFTKEINGEKYSTNDLKEFVSKLVRIAANSGDEMLLQFVAKACASFEESKESVESMAQLHFDLTWSSAALRKTYKNDSMALEGITVVGLAS